MKNVYRMYSYAFTTRKGKLYNGITTTKNMDVFRGDTEDNVEKLLRFLLEHEGVKWDDMRKYSVVGWDHKDTKEFCENFLNPGEYDGE